MALQPSISPKSAPLPETRLAGSERPWVQKILPFLTSLTLHAGILVLAVAAVNVAVNISPPRLSQEQIIIPDGSIVEAKVPGSIPNTGPDDNALRQVGQDEILTGAKPQGWASKAGPRVDLSSGGAPGESDVNPTIALGVGAIGGSRNGGPGAGTDDGSGPLAQWGVPGGGAIGPHGLFFGNRGNARKIVFVCDATGSMLNKMASLKNELEKAVNGLTVVQSFDVIFFQEDKCLALNVNGLEPATAESKRKTFRFLDDVTATGTTNPLPSIQTAFRLQPDLIYILSDAADFPDNNAVLELCRKLNASHKTRVNTILFYENHAEADRNKDSEELMVQIARDAGGKFKPVIMTELEN